MSASVLEPVSVHPTTAAPTVDRKPSFRRRVAFPLIACMMALLAACTVAEIALRIGGFGHNYTNPMGSFFLPDGQIGCRGKPNFVGRFRRADFDVTIEHNENGFRRSEPVQASGSRNVYVLGDSFVWGYGIGQRDLLTNQLARRLGSEVHNYGLIGAGTVQEYLIFQKHVAPRLRAGDTVVLMFFGNDFGDNVGRNLQGRLYAKIDNGQIELVPPAATSDLRQWKNWLKDVSYLFNLASYCVDRFQDTRSTRTIGDRGSRRVPPPEQIQAETSDRSPAVQITRHCLAALRDECRAKQARFLAVFVPGQGELNEDDVTSTSDLCLPEEIACRQAFGRAVSELGIETVDLLAPLAAAKRSGRFPRVTFVHDFHWNAAGNTVAAEVIAGRLQE